MVRSVRRALDGAPPCSGSVPLVGSHLVPYAQAVGPCPALVLFPQVGQVVAVHGAALGIVHHL